MNPAISAVTRDPSVRRTWLGPFYANTVLIQALAFVLRPTAIYRALELNVPVQWLGALGASYAVVPLLLAVPAGLASDRWGERRVIVLGSVLTVSATIAFLMLDSTVWGLLGASVLLGMGHLLCVVGQQALVANRAGIGSHDTAFGHYTFAASAGQALGPALIVFLGGRESIPDVRLIFVCAVGLAVLMLALTLLLPATSRAQRQSARDAGSMRVLLQRPGLVRALTVSCVVLAAVDISLIYLPVLGTELGISAGVVGALLVLRAVASMTSRFFLGRLSSWMGRRRLLMLSIGLAAAGMAMIPAPLPVWLLGLVVVVMGLGLGAGQPLTMAWLAEATPPGLRGRAMSLRLTGNRLGQVIVPSLTGLVAASAGAGGVLWLTAAALAAAGLGSRGIPNASPPQT